MVNNLNKKAWAFFWARQKKFVFIILFGCAFYLVFFLFFFNYLVAQIVDLKKKESSLAADLENIAASYKQRGQINEKLLNGSEKINTYLPNSFELVTIINVIDKLSQRTQFTIHSYNLAYQKSPVNGELKIMQVNFAGKGSKESFLKFLKSYRFISGQMLTVKAVNLTAKSTVESSLSVDLYSFKPDIKLENLPEITKIDETDSKYLDEINKYAFIDNLEKIKLEYAAKENPFEK